MKIENDVTLQSKQLAEYFKQRPEYKRLLKGIKNKYIVLGEMKGNILLNNPDKLEKQALSGLMKKDYSKNKSISINLKILEHGLYQNWKKYYNKNKEELKKALLNACKGINNLPEKRTRIPVFASNITGNPHELDKNILCGKIFIMLLCYMQNVKVPQSSEELAEIYYSCNLLIDDVSNMVLCKNIRGFTKGEETIEYGQKCTRYMQHQGLNGFAKYNEPIYLNLYNLSNIGFLDKYHQYNKVVVMENPAVFMEVSERCKKRDFPLVCTYGQVKLSGLILLDMLVEQKYEIYYSGDIDPEGIQIADKLKNRYQNNLYFLGFDVNTYKQNLSNVEVSLSRLKKLDKIESVDLQDVCKELKLTKRVSFEEKNMNAIIDFINKV